jgi:hypothetical protein
MLLAAKKDLTLADCGRSAADSTQLIFGHDVQPWPRSNDPGVAESRGEVYQSIGGCHFGGSATAQPGPA